MIPGVSPRLKASVAQMRAAAKDGLAIDAILMEGRIDLPTALASAQAIHGQTFNPLVTLKALSRVADGTVSRLPPDGRDRLAQAARTVDLNGVPIITSSAGAA